MDGWWCRVGHGDHLRVGGGLVVSEWFRCPGRRGTGASARSRSCGLRRPCSGGTSREAWAWLCVPSGQWWAKPLMSQVTRPWMVKTTGV